MRDVSGFLLSRSHVCAHDYNDPSKYNALHESDDLLGYKKTKIAPRVINQCLWYHTIVILKQRFPDRAGFQSTYCGTDDTCTPQGEGTIQIHFDDERKYWLTAIFSSKRIHFFDSLCTAFIPDGLQQQMRTIVMSYFFEQFWIKSYVSSKNRVSQTVVAVHLANENDPAKVNFEQKMRALL